MNCKKAQFMMCLYIADDPALTDKERSAFINHLRNCQECAREYEESRFVIDLAREHWQVSEGTLALMEKANKQVKPHMTVEVGWQDLCKCCPDLVESAEKSKSLQLFLRIGAIAACLVIGILTWKTFSNYLKPHFLPQSSSTKQVASIPKPSVKVELISDNNKVLVPPGYKIAASKELKTLVINDKHRMVMNVNTTLTVEPLVEGSNLGCLVKLALGEILAHVEYDGNPFVVSTAHSKAVITGTIFDVKATDFSTTLVVTEGTVQFESEEGFVKVTAEHTSEIVAQSTPAKPTLCDTAKLTAWAVGQELKTASANIESFSDTYDITDLWLNDMSGSTNLENIDYEDWIEEKRDWFKEEFPWIFQLREALAKEGVEVDYPELLIKTGDVWQFVCLETSPARFSVINPDSLLKIASDYGFAKQWLLENVSSVKHVLEKLVLPNNAPASQQAFKQWLKYLDETEELKPPTSIYSYCASNYLANTRSLIWFAIRDGKYDLTNKVRAKVLFLLQEEVAVACKCQNRALYQEEKHKPSCFEDKYQDNIELVSIIYEYEKALVKYISFMSSTFN